MWTNYTYDDLGRSTGVTGPRGTATVAYAGLQTVMTNEKGQQRTEVRNALGKLRTLTNAKGKSTHYEYEPFGNLAQVTDAQGNQIKLSYDKLGRKTKLNDPDLGTWTYVLNALGELRSQTDTKGQTTQQRYDALGRLQTRLGPEQCGKKRNLEPCRRFSGSSTSIWQSKCYPL